MSDIKKFKKRYFRLNGVDERFMILKRILSFFLSTLRHSKRGEKRLDQLIPKEKEMLDSTRGFVGICVILCVMPYKPYIYKCLSLDNRNKVCTKALNS